MNKPFYFDHNKVLDDLKPFIDKMRPISQLIEVEQRERIQYGVETNMKVYTPDPDHLNID